MSDSQSKELGFESLLLLFLSLASVMRFERFNGPDKYFAI